MADSRRHRIELLLATRYDHLWFPNGSLHTTTGLAPGQRRPCPDCHHSTQPGWTHDRYGRRTPCTTCGGQQTPSGTGGQWLTKDRGAGYIWVDSMDTFETPVGDQETKASARPRKTVRCDACDGEGVRMGARCQWCDGAGRRDLHRFELHIETELDPAPTPVEDAIIRRDQQGSYAELDRAVAGVRHHVNKPLRFCAVTVHAGQALRLLDEVFLSTRERDTLSPFEAELLEMTLGYVDSRMPAVVRVPADVVANARIRAEHRTLVKGRQHGRQALERRDREIVRLARRGRAAQWIAGEYGLSVSSVYAIVAASEREHVA